MARPRPDVGLVVQCRDNVIPIHDEQTMADVYLARLRNERDFFVAERNRVDLEKLLPARLFQALRRRHGDGR
jgi:hypothetical protein